MRVLVLGGTGFLGPDVVRELVDAGATVTIFHTGRHEASLPPDVAHVHGERDKLADHHGEFLRFPPDVVLDMAPMIEAHAQMTMAAFRGLARRVVAISSADVYRAYGRMHGTEPGPPEPTPLREDAPLREHLYPYRDFPRPMPHAEDYDKILIERCVLGDAELPGTVLRLSLVHGPRSYRYFEYLKRMDDGRSAILLGSSIASWRGTRAYSEDVGRAIALAVLDEHPAGRVYNVGESAGVTEAEWVRQLAAAAGWRGRLVQVPRGSVPEHLRERLPKWMMWEEKEERQDLVLDTSRLRAELGYAEGVPRDEGLRRTVAWMREHPPQAQHPVIRGGFDYAAEDELLAALAKR